MSTCRDITAAARGPRAAFVDFPNGNTTGKVGQPALTRSILASAFDLLSSSDEVLVDLDHVWDETDDWKDAVFMPEVSASTGKSEMLDDRVEGFDVPQYQTDSDAAAAQHTHADQDCLVCIGIDI